MLYLKEWNIIMKKADFLTKMKKQGSLELVEVSNNISKSYSDKSDKCMQVAKLAFDADIFENSITEAYYAIYNSVLSLFFACGIKCENHSVSVILINKLFKLHKLQGIFLLSGHSLFLPTFFTSYFFFLLSICLIALSKSLNKILLSAICFAIS